MCSSACLLNLPPTAGSPFPLKLIRGSPPDGVRGWVGVLGCVFGWLVGGWGVLVWPVGLPVVCTCDRGDFRVNVGWDGGRGLAPVRLRTLLVSRPTLLVVALECTIASIRSLSLLFRRDRVYLVCIPPLHWMAVSWPLLGAGWLVRHLVSLCALPVLVVTVVPLVRSGLRLLVDWLLFATLRTVGDVFVPILPTMALVSLLCLLLPTVTFVELSVTVVELLAVMYMFVVTMVFVVTARFCPTLPLNLVSRVRLGRSNGSLTFYIPMYRSPMVPMHRIGRKTVVMSRFAILFRAPLLVLIRFRRATLTPANRTLRSLNRVMIAGFVIYVSTRMSVPLIVCWFVLGSMVSRSNVRNRLTVVR